MILSQTFDSSSSSAKYTAQFDTATGKGTCNCPGWTKRAVRECKHTKALAADDRNGGAGGIIGKIGKSSAECQSPATCGVSHKTQLPVPVDPFRGFREPPAVKPMLASAMKEGQSLEDFLSDEWVMEEKFDGHRLLLVVGSDETVTGWSRPGHDRPSAERSLPEHIMRDAKLLPPGIYDGELRIPEGTSSDVVRLDLQDKLVLTLFDAIEIGGVKVAYHPLFERRKALELAVAHLDVLGSAIGVQIAGQQPVDLHAIQYIWKRGGEGAILKRLSSTYRSGWRTPDWIKVKQIDAAEFTIIGFDEGKNGPCSIFKLRHDDGRETSCKVLTNELLRLVHKDPQSYIGRRVTVAHMGFTKSGLWRHPVFDHFNQEG